MRPERAARHSGVLQPLDAEISVIDLPVEGAIPPELDGLYVRNSFNPHPVLVGGDGALPHLFLGDGMIHGVRLAAGRACWYRNRWVRTESLAAATGQAAPPGPPDRRWVPHNPANLNVIVHAGRLLALCDVGMPYALSAELETLGCYDFGGQLTANMSAHPKRDPATGELHFVNYRPWRPWVTYFCADAAGRIVRSQAIDVAGATAMHDFAVTQRFAVFIDQPLLFERPPRPGGGLPFCWDRGYTMRLGLLELHRSDAPVRWFEIEPCFIPHVLNAFDDGDTVVLRAVVSDPYYMTGDAPAAQACLGMHEWRIDLAGGRVAHDCLSDAPGELPRLDERRVGRPHRFGYAAEIRLAQAWHACGGLFKYDFVRDTVTRHEVGPHEMAAEPVFVPARASSGEDEGWVLSFVYDATTDRSALIVLDARRFAGAPLARITLPQRVPYGAHGSWVSQADLDAPPCQSSR
ncbi:carotenoid oxygenase family protein [Pandoraea sp.]|uniref:carotenoid oxygenase family protein n=1 Tax=Pandoraea sp. TaxID=1883445 RepID=UPI0025E3F71B|nr:carotenoid oxygenase family protein [Pandoraea sp.]